MNRDVCIMTLAIINDHPLECNWPNLIFGLICFPDHQINGNYKLDQR